jgi:hypothetical protein
MIVMTVGKDQLHGLFRQRPDIGGHIFETVAGVEQQRGVPSLDQGKLTPMASVIWVMPGKGLQFVNMKNPPVLFSGGFYHEQA